MKLHGTLKGVIVTVCLLTTATVWVLINIAAHHYLISTVATLSTYSLVVLRIAFLISALSGVGYLIYK